MSTIPALLAQLEASINAVEPRVLAECLPGLSNSEIDAILASEPFDLPADLRALYRWRNGADLGLLGSYCSMFPLTFPTGEPETISPPFTLQDKARYLREEVIMWFEMVEEPPPINVDKTEFLYLFDTFGDGSSYVALRPKSERETCQIWTFDTGDLPLFYQTFNSVESMIETALAWWESGVFAPRYHQFGWDLETDWEKYGALGKQLNPQCSCWEERGFIVNE